LITNPQHAALDQHLSTALVQLPKADDARLQLQDLVDVRWRPVFTVPAPEQDSAAAADHHPGAIAELDAPGGLFVQLGEGGAAPCHVVARARFQVPALLQLVADRPQMDLRTWLVKIDGLRSNPLLCLGARSTPPS